MALLLHGRGVLLAVFVTYFSAAAAAGSTSAVLVPAARTYKDAARKTCESFLIVAPMTFGWSATPLFFARQPEMALKIGLRSAQRWGGTSAGFSGGRAFTQVIRQTDDVWCAAAGGLAAGLLGSPSIGLIPARVCGFVGLSILLETQLLPRLQELTAAQPPTRSKPKPIETRSRSATAGRTPLAPRPPWGSRTPWAEEPWMKAISRLDERRQAFEDACVTWLTSGESSAPGRVG